MISQLHLELSRLLTRSFRKQFSCQRLRATTIHAFLDSKEFEELERAAKHFNSLKSEREVQTRTPNTALVAAQQLDFDLSHSATSHNPYRYSRYIRVPRHSSGV
jgi:hypothetical protein